ncbi:Sterol O-acyltransferase 2 (Sterol-ester synthase 2) [Taxawa tesnikishii (nom. ined.)]|nr:Sterol O-acyltransferase 2 (Sterol-ester synthase 2) [Dothideales sp. JES 119]
MVISQAYIYPPVAHTVRMKEAGMSLQERWNEYPWIVSDLLFPLLLEQLLSWYVIWECVLNVVAELTRFADRGFYGDWWNSVSWDQYARDWNRPVHNFLLRHVYHSSISAFHLSKSSATFVTFLLSALVHELVMACLFRKVRGYLFTMQLLQLPLVSLSRTKLLKGRNLLGNISFLMTGDAFALYGMHGQRTASRIHTFATERSANTRSTAGPLQPPRNVGSMNKNDTDVGTGLVGAPACGDVMKLQIKVDPKDNTISDVKFKTFGCGSAIASSSYLTELVRGMTLEQAGRIKNTEIAKELCLPPVKLHCSMLAEDAIKSAISNYYTKNPKARQTDLGGTSAAMPKVEIETVSADQPAAAA